MYEQISELQMLLMEQQQSLETMSEQVMAHSNKIRELEEKIELIHIKLNQILALSTQALEAMDEPSPPHY